jgi:PAS domain S-box-containing protein
LNPYAWASGVAMKYQYEGFALPEIPDNEKQRLAALKRLKVLDTLPDANLDEITELASEICGTKIALISLIDADRQWFKAKVGLDLEETSRDLAFCGHAINEVDPLIINDTHLDERFRNHPLVVDGVKIRFYAGAQLTTSSGENIGTVCVIDSSPKHLNEKQIKALKLLARQVIANFEHKMLAETMIEREQFFHNLLSMVPDLFSYVTDDYRYQFINPSYERVFQRPREEIIGMKMPDLVGDKSFEAIRPYLENAFKGKAQEFKILTPVNIHGLEMERYAWIHYYPDIKPDGSIAGVYSVHRDITELKEAEIDAIDKGDRLEIALMESTESEKSFRALFDDSPVATVRLNQDLRIISCNDSFAQTLGYSAEELINMNILDLTLPEDISKTKEIAQSVMKSQSGIHRTEKHYRHKSGEVLLCLVTTKAVKHIDGQCYFLKIIEDITESRHKEDQLREMQGMLVSSAKMASLGEMAGSIAHEINNPLAIINFKTDMIRNRVADGTIDAAQIESGLVDIKNTAKRIAKIVKGLRHFSRNSEGDPMEIVPFSKILEETLELCDQRFRNSGIGLHVNYSGDDIIECRPIQISQILMNLLNNAFDAVGNFEERWVKVDIAATEHSLTIRVIDSGHGIPVAIVDKLMEPFFTTKDVGHGTGLGLSISNGVAMAHRGRIAYELYKGNTSFILDLPKKQPQLRLKTTA